MPCECGTLAMVPLEGRLLLLVVKLGLALDVGGVNVALVFQVIARMLRFQVGRYELTRDSRFRLVAQEALRVVELRGVIQLVFAIVEVRVWREEAPIVLGRVLRVDWRVHDRVVGRQALRVHGVIDLRKTTRRR